MYAFFVRTISTQRREGAEDAKIAFSMPTPAVE
jgi:hypothetical protein